MKKMLRAVAMTTLVCFLTTQTAMGAPGASIEMADGRERPSYLNIDIPAGLGTVDSLYEAPASANPQFILHIQNAHANYQAQMKIKQLLDHMNKQYGFKTIFVEGASEKLDADYLRLFPDRERNLKLCDELAKQGELTGAELYLMEADKNIEALGIEEAALYRSNYEALKKVFGAEPAVARFFKGFDGKLDRVASKTFTPETRELIADWKRFEQGRREFMPFVQSLAKKSKKILNIDLESLFAQVGWPQITRLLVVQQMEKELNRSKALEEKAALLKTLRSQGASQELLTAIENFNEGSITVGKSTREVSPREVLERLALEMGPKNFKFSDWPAFSLFAGFVTLRSELDPKALFDEIEYLFTQMLDTLAGEPQQKALLALYRDGELLRKLLHLELNRAQWRQVVESKDRVAVPALVDRLKDAVIASGDVSAGKDRQVMPKDFSSKMDGLFTAGLEFYDFAHQREAVFYKEMQTAMKERKITKAVLITGGFHTDGMSDLFRENAVSYGIVTPRLSEKSDENLYRKIMLQNENNLFSLSYLEARSRMQSYAAQFAQTGRIDVTRIFQDFMSSIGETNPVKALDSYRSTPAYKKLLNDGFDITAENGRIKLDRRGVLAETEVTIDGTIAAKVGTITPEMLSGVTPAAVQPAAPAARFSAWASISVALGLFFAALNGYAQNAGEFVETFLMNGKPAAAYIVNADYTGVEKTTNFYKSWVPVTPKVLMKGDAAIAPIEGNAIRLASTGAVVAAKSGTSATKAVSQPASVTFNPDQIPENIKNEFLNAGKNVVQIFDEKTGSFISVPLVPVKTAIPRRRSEVRTLSQAEVDALNAKLEGKGFKVVLVGGMVNVYSVPNTGYRAEVTGLINIEVVGTGLKITHWNSKTGEEEETPTIPFNTPLTPATAAQYGITVETSSEARVTAAELEKQVSDTLKKIADSEPLSNVNGDGYEYYGIVGGAKRILEEHLRALKGMAKNETVSQVQTDAVLVDIANAITSMKLANEKITESYRSQKEPYQKFLEEAREAVVEGLQKNYTYNGFGLAWINKELAGVLRGEGGRFGRAEMRVKEGPLSAAESKKLMDLFLSGEMVANIIKGMKSSHAKGTAGYYADALRALQAEADRAGKDDRSYGGSPGGIFADMSHSPGDSERRAARFFQFLLEGRKSGSADIVQAFLNRWSFIRNMKSAYAPGTRGYYVDALRAFENEARSMENAGERLGRGADYMIDYAKASAWTDAHIFRDMLRLINEIRPGLTSAALRSEARTLLQNDLKDAGWEVLDDVSRRGIVRNISRKLVAFDALAEKPSLRQFRENYARYNDSGTERMKRNLTWDAIYFEAVDVLSARLLFQDLANQILELVLYDGDGRARLSAERDLFLKELRESVIRAEARAGLDYASVKDLPEMKKLEETLRDQRLSGKVKTMLEQFQKGAIANVAELLDGVEAEIGRLMDEAYPDINERTYFDYAGSKTISDAVAAVRGALSLPARAEVRVVGMDYILAHATPAEALQIARLNAQIASLREKMKGYRDSSDVPNLLKQEFADAKQQRMKVAYEVRHRVKMPMAPEVETYLNDIMSGRVEAAAVEAHNGWLAGKRATLDNLGNPFVGWGPARVRVKNVVRADGTIPSREALSAQVGAEIGEVKYAAILAAIQSKDAGQLGQDITHNLFKSYEDVKAAQMDGGVEFSSKNAIPLLVLAQYLTAFRAGEIQSLEDLRAVLEGLMNGKDEVGLEEVSRLNHTAFEALVLGQGERSKKVMVRQRVGEAVTKAARTDFAGFDTLTKDVQGLDEYTLLPAADWMLQQIDQVDKTLAVMDFLNQTMSDDVEAAAAAAHNLGWLKGKQASLADPTNPFVGLGNKRVRVRDVVRPDGSVPSREELSRQIGVEITPVKYGAILASVESKKTGADITHHQFRPYAEVLANEPDGGVELSSKNALPLLTLALYLTDFRASEIKNFSDLEKVVGNLKNGTDKVGIDQVSRLMHAAFESFVLGQGERGIQSLVRQRAGDAVEIAARTDFKGFDFLTTDVQGLDQYTLLPAVIWMIKDLAVREESVARVEVRLTDAEVKALETILSGIAFDVGYDELTRTRARELAQNWKNISTPEFVKELEDVLKGMPSVFSLETGMRIANDWYDQLAGILKKFDPEAINRLAPSIAEREPTAPALVRSEIRNVEVLLNLQGDLARYPVMDRSIEVGDYTAEIAERDSLRREFQEHRNYMEKRGTPGVRVESLRVAAIVKNDIGAVWEAIEKLNEQILKLDFNLLMPAISKASNWVIESSDRTAGDGVVNGVRSRLIIQDNGDQIIVNQMVGKVTRATVFSDEESMTAIRSAVPGVVRAEARVTDEEFGRQHDWANEKIRLLKETTEETAIEHVKKILSLGNPTLGQTGIGITARLQKMIYDKNGVYRSSDEIFKTRPHLLILDLLGKARAETRETEEINLAGALVEAVDRESLERLEETLTKTPFNDLDNLVNKDEISGFRPALFVAAVFTRGIVSNNPKHVRAAVEALIGIRELVDAKTWTGLVGKLRDAVPNAKIEVSTESGNVVKMMSGLGDVGEFVNRVLFNLFLNENTHFEFLDWVSSGNLVSENAQKKKILVALNLRLKTLNRMELLKQINIHVVDEAKPVGARSLFESLVGKSYVVSGTASDLRKLDVANLRDAVMMNMPTITEDPGVQGARQPLVWNVLSRAAHQVSGLSGNVVGEFDKLLDNVKESGIDRTKGGFFITPQSLDVLATNLSVLYEAFKAISAAA